MNATSRSKVIMFVLLVVVLGLFAPLAQAGPSLVRLTGTLYRPGEKAVTGMNTFMVFFQGENWVFDVKEVKNLSGTQRGMEVLRNIFPSTLYFRGPQNLITCLEKPEVAGEPVTVEGYIYVPSRLLQVTAIRSAAC